MPTGTAKYVQNPSFLLVTYVPVVLASSSRHKRIKKHLSLTCSTIILNQTFTIVALSATNIANSTPHYHAPTVST